MAPKCNLLTGKLLIAFMKSEMKYETYFLNVSSTYLNS